MEGKAYRYLSRLFAESGDYTRALEANYAGLTVFQELNEPREGCIMYISRGVIYPYLKQYDESISSNLKAAELAKKKQLTELQAAIYGNLGNVYFDKEDYNQALKNHQKS